MKTPIDMVTVLAKDDYVYNDRKFFKGTTYTLRASTASKVISDSQGSIVILERSGPVRRDKTIHEFRAA